MALEQAAFFHPRFLTKRFKLFPIGRFIYFKLAFADGSLIRLFLIFFLQLPFATFDNGFPQRAGQTKANVL